MPERLPFSNPLVNSDFPDPSVLHVPGKGYYAYATHDAFSPTINNILVRFSLDMVNWTDAEGALLAPPDWAKFCDKFWCPQVVFVNGEYRLYYAAEPDTRDGMCLAMAVSSHPVGFTDCGHPLSRVAGSTYQMIDPCFFADPVSGKHFLYYGSAHEPIRVVELAADGKTFISEPMAVLQPGEGDYHKLREGAFITYQPAFNRYLLWVSGHNTWDVKSYAVSVFWSADPLGVFEKVPVGHLLLEANEQWDSPGQNCILADAAGNDWIVYHAVDNHDRYIPGTHRFLRKMCMDRVLYTNEGWSYVLHGSPSFGVEEGFAV